MNSNIFIDIYNSKSVTRGPKREKIIEFLRILSEEILTMFDTILLSKGEGDFVGEGGIDMDNIFPLLYQMFRILLAPMGKLDNESDFIFCMFALASPLLSTYDDFIFVISKQYQYYMRYSNSNDLFRIPMTLFTITRTIYRKIIGIPEVYNISDYILPSSIKSLTDLNEIVQYLPEDIILSGYCLYCVMQNIGITHLLPVGVPAFWPADTFETVFTLTMNVISKLAYTNACAILCLSMSISPFHYITSSRPFQITVFESPISISNVCLNCVDVLPFSMFSNPKIISCVLKFNDTDPLLLSFESGIYWRNVFSLLKAKQSATGVRFNTSYIALVSMEALEILCSLFLIRDDMICVFERRIYLLLGEALYARPSVFAFANVLPGRNILRLTDMWASALSSTYNVSSTYYSLLVKYGSSVFDHVSVNYILDAVRFIGTYRERTCDALVQKCDSNADKLMYIYLLHKHISDGRIFGVNPPITIKSGVRNFNADLLTYLLGVNSFKQIFINFPELEFKWMPNEPDMDALLAHIEKQCIKSFNSLTDKNTLSPLCRCLYRDGNDLSPICFDTRCMTSLSDENAIYIPYKCKYPTCSQSVDISNFISNSMDISKIAYQASCGAFDTRDSITAGKYYIYFPGGLYWSIDPVGFIITGTFKGVFTLQYDKSNILYIKNVGILSRRLVRDAKDMPIIVGLVENNIYLMHKYNSSVIYGDGKFVYCDYTTSTNGVIFMTRV